MYPHHVFDLEPAGTFGMYPICYQWVSGRYFQPEPAMYSRCFHRFPGPLAPSVKRRISSKRQPIWSCVASHFSEKMMLFFSMVSWLTFIIVKTSWWCFSASASIQQIYVIWALHSTSASSTCKQSVRRTSKVFRSLFSPGIQASLSWVGNEAR